MLDSRRKIRSRNKRLFAALLVLALILLALVTQFGPPAFIRQFGTALASPVWRLHAAVLGKGNGLTGLFASKRALMSENDVLHRELERERLKVFRAEQIMDENRELKMLLGRSDETNYTLAYVLARPALTPYDTMLIDAGSSKGVSVGDLVFGEASVVIGEVRDVFPGNSRAVLFSSPGVETDVFLPDGGASGVARGLGHGNFVMRLPQDIAVGEGDAIMMPGDAMLLGFVSAVERLVGDVFQTVRFRTLVNVSTLTRVFVASPPGTR